MSNPSTGSGCNFRIARPDKKNWVLEEWSAGIDPRTRRQSPGAWRPIGYYGKIEDLLTYLVNRQIELPEGTLQNQIGDLLAELKAVEARIVEGLNQSAPV